MTISRRAFVAAATAALVPHNVVAAGDATPPVIVKRDVLTPASLALVDGFRAAMDTGRYVPVLKTAELYSGAVGFEGIAAQAYCMVGDERSALIQNERGPGFPSHYEKRRLRAHRDLANVQALPAIEAIVREVRDRQIVMINEAHCMSRHRAFTRALAVQLRRVGFDWFAAETFDVSASRLKPGVAFERGMGFYTNDAVFAETVREIRDLGFKITPYDYSDPDTPQQTDQDQASQDREDRSAQHILERVFARDPKARLLVHVGYGHLNKALMMAPKRVLESFAMRLQQVTGIEPFCIDQTAGSPGSSPEHDNDYLAEVLAKFRPDQPVVLRTESGAPFATPDGGDVDERVYHPRVSDVQGRPGWLAQIPGTQFRQFDLKLARSHDCRLVLAYSTAEASPKIVPSDIIVLDDIQTQAAFALHPGRYAIRGENDEGFVELGSVDI